ncbi:MAG: DUF433 domain-containing protein [Vicinamibacteria bacterium]
MSSSSDRITYPHVSLDPAVREGRACISGTQVRVTDLATASEAGRSILELKEHFAPQKLTLAEIHAGLAYFYDNWDALEAVRLDDQRLVDKAKKDREAELLRHFLGQ